MIILFLLFAQTSQPASSAASEPASQPVVAEVPFELPPLPQPASAPVYEVETVSVLGSAIDEARLGGAAYSISAKKLETFRATDVHRVLAEVPGVYTRDEDGFGLRPNIGLRGASSDRSAKVSLLEDGILLAPAPYAAPAAYYFPLMNRITKVEVFKGPASIKYGPQTIGGAVNLMTRPVPRKLILGADVAGGMYGSANAHAYWGYGGDHAGILMEGAYQHSDGFKRLPNQERTGFDRGELTVKASFNTPYNARFAHRWDVKAGIQYELSNETYLGLSDADFAASPYSRYAASQNDVMRSWRTQAEIGYLMLAGEMWELSVRAYRHDQSRQWKKLNGIEGAPPLASVFANADGAQNRLYLSVLRGETDSTATERLLIGTNDRRYVSQGIQATVTAHPVVGEWAQDIELGVRLHQDQVERLHDDFAHIMFRGEPVLDDPTQRINARNLGSAVALALHVQDQITFRRLRIVPGLRIEYINTFFHDREADTRANANTLAVLPGIGAFYGITENIGVLAGVHRGFSPRSPGQVGTVTPEYSISYEAGTRAQWRTFFAEAVAFVSDYQNLTGECTFSSGCSDSQVGQQFNGGAALVYGVEAMARYSHMFDVGVELRAQASYTLTLSEFRTDFQSDNPLWGDVAIGDALPYVPVHQASATFGIGMKRWGVDATVRVVSEMRDVAGQGPIAPSAVIPTYAVADLAAFFVLPGDVRLFSTLENITNATYIVSRRPFGARPGKPITFMAGISYAL